MLTFIFWMGGGRGLPQSPASVGVGSGVGAGVGSGEGPGFGVDGVGVGAGVPPPTLRDGMETVTMPGAFDSVLEGSVGSSSVIVWQPTRIAATATIVPTPDFDI
jgi:hypothetical protein